MRTAVLLAMLTLASPALAQAPCSAAGLVADARNAQGTFNPQPTDNRAALQADFDACDGGSLTIPAGNYYVLSHGGGAGLAITHPMVLRMEPGAVLWVDGDATTDALLVETTPLSTAWSNMRPVDVQANIRGWHLLSGSAGRHGIVVHTVGARVHDSYVAEVQGWGVLVESGTAGSTPGASRLPSGAGINANFARVERVTVADDGDQGYTGDFVKGGGVWVHGSDANGVIVSDSVATYVNIGFADGSLEGVTWLRNYVEVGGPGNAVGYMDFSSAGARYYDCREEIAHPSPIAPPSRVYGGGLARGLPASAVDNDVYAFVRPLRNTRDRWTWRQRVTVPPGVSVQRTATSWATSATIMHGDPRQTSDMVHVTADVELPTVNDWATALPMQVADAQVALRATQLLALDVQCGPVARGYQDAAGGLFLVRCVSGLQAPVDVDLVWTMEIFQRSQANTVGP